MEMNSKPETQAAQAREPEPPAGDPAAEVRADMEKYKDLAYRAAAELENFKRRSSKEREEAMGAVKERIISRILPIVDALDLAEAAIDPGGTAENQKIYLDGMKAIRRQMTATLESMGVREIELPADAEFHPGEQEAVLTEEVAGLKTPKILQILQKGYRLDGRLIRPVRVKVGMPKSESMENERGDQA